MKDSKHIYAQSRMQILEEFGGCISGSSEGLFVALCTAELSSASRNALIKSDEALGYGSDGVSFVQLDANSSPTTDAQLWSLLEGLDPLCIVISNPNALTFFCQAYRIDIPNQAAFRVACREIRALPNLDSLMTTSQGKQLAWSSLKTLPRLQSK